MGRAFRIVSTAFVIVFYFVVGPLGYAGFALYRLIPTRHPERRKQIFQTVLYTAFRSMHAILTFLRILRFDPRGIAEAIPEGACVLVANHPTLTDTSALLGSVPRLTFSVKPSLFEQFWARPLYEMAGAFAGSGTDPFSVGRFVDDAVARLERGDRVLLFPEGTRSKGPEPDEFGRAPFEIARRAGVPIVPIAIRCTPHWLAKHHHPLDPPRTSPRLEIRVLESVSTKDSGSSSRELRDIVRARISRALAEHESARVDG